MIEDYTDHAANERTYLAWVRTALAFMAFGLLVERFDILAALSGLDEPSLLGGTLTRSAGLVLIFLGVLVLATATTRYLQFKALISSQETRAFQASRTDLVLIGIVALLGVSMTAYTLGRAFAY